MPKVSVIVPVYNVERYVRKCIKSLVRQTLKEIEIIIVDDGSEDESANIIKEYMKEYPQIKYYKKTNGGLSDARNYGLQYATGKYIAFLDADDYVEYNTYFEMYSQAMKSRADMVECDFYWTYEKKEKQDVGERYYKKEEIMEKARVVAWNKLYKKELLENAKVLFPKGLQYEDIEFFYKLIPYIHKVSFVKKPLIHYVQRKESIINSQNEKVRDIFKVFDNIVRYYKEKKIYDDYKEAIEYSCARILLCSSLKRCVKISNVDIRNKMLNKTWVFLNSKFPNWKENNILNNHLNLKKIYLLSVNRVTFKIYCKIFRHI